MSNPLVRSYVIDILPTSLTSITLPYILSVHKSSLNDMADSDDITDLVQEFMAVTGAEDVTAMRYLQQSNWNVEVSVL